MQCLYRVVDKPDVDSAFWSSSMVYAEQLLPIVTSYMAFDPAKRPSARD